MDNNDGSIRRIESDLGLNAVYIKGQNVSIRNCWHFFTNGSDVDQMFYEGSDFVDGMNRIYLVLQKYKVIILAFVLMDTHVHFILYGEYGDCNGFVHEYIKRTSEYIAKKHNENRKLDCITISHQAVTTDLYLKTVICYTIKNPTTGGLHFMPQNYPWSSGPLYFASSGNWSPPLWTYLIKNSKTLIDYNLGETRKLLHTRENINTEARVLGEIVFPGDYVAYDFVERIFKSCKSFQYFMGQSKDSEIEAQGGSISNLSLPMQEMRQHCKDYCLELFGASSVKTLGTTDRLKLAKELRIKYNSSKKQIARLCGLNYEDVKDMI